MLTSFTDWLFGRARSDSGKSELNRLAQQHRHGAEHVHDWLNAHDPIDRAHKGLRHERRVTHHAHEFWHSPQEHPTSVLADEHIPQIACLISDRELAREYCIRCYDLTSLYDCLEEAPKTESPQTAKSAGTLQS